MKAISWEDKFSLSSRQEEIIIGSLLGDGRLECRSKQGTARFRVHHADSQREFLFWKFSELQKFVARKPWCTDWYDGRYDRWYRSWFFHTKTIQQFTHLYRWFYTDNKKIVPLDIAERLSELAFAVWIADDGCVTKDSLILNTQSFHVSEQKILLSALDRRYSICGSINRDRNNFRLRFNRSSAKRARRIIEKFSIPALNDKFIPVTTDSAKMQIGGGNKIKPLQHAGSEIIG